MTTLLCLLCQSTALLLLGLFALRLTRRFGPSVQSLVGRASLAGVALLLLLAPLTGHIRPMVRVPEPTPQQHWLPAGQAATLSIKEDEEVRTEGIAGGSIPKTNAVPAEKVSAAEATEQEAALGQKSAAEQEGAASSASTVSTPVPPAPRPPAVPATEERAGKEVGFSLATTLALLLWLGICQFHLIRLRRSAAPVVSGPAAALLAELTPHPPALLTHPSVHSPFLAGLHRPAIFLPAAFAADFTPDALRAIFLHELAHRDRRDTSWTLAARLLTAVFWFQPLLWLLARKLEQISEDACDAAVLVQCPPRAYAACLLSLAERPPLARSQRTLTTGVAPFRSSLGRRISRILTLGVPTMPAVTLRLRLTAAALTLAAALGGAFLISSAPAQPKSLTFKKPSVVGIWLGPSWGGERSVLVFSQDGQLDQVSGWPGNDKEVSHWLGTYTAAGSHMTWRLTHVKVGDAPLAYATSPTLRDLVYHLSGDALTMHLNVKGGWTQISHRIAAYTPEMLGITPTVVPDAQIAAKANLAPAQQREYLKQKIDIINLELIGTAITKYAENHQEQLPDADHWMDQIQPYLIFPNVYYDPFRQGQKEFQKGPKEYGYAFNRNCSKQLLTVFPKPGQTVIVFDSPFAARNASSTGGTVRTWKKPTDKALIPGSGILFVNGKSAWLSSDLVSFSVTGETLGMAARDMVLTRLLQSAGERPSSGSPLGQAQFLAGLTPVQGPGVVVTLRDSKKPFSYPKGGWPAGMTPPNIIHDIDINQVVNELKAAGAEAIAVNDQRFVATSATRSAGPTVYVNNTPQRPPYVIEAIGDPKALTTMLTMRGGEADQIKQFDPAMFSVRQAAALTLPAYSGSGEMHYAKPIKTQQMTAANVVTDFTRKPTLAAAIQEQLVATQSRLIEITDRIAVLNAQVEAKRQRAKKELGISPPSPLATNTMNQNVLHGNIKPSHEMRSLDRAITTAQERVAAMANLPPQNPARLGAQHSLGNLVAKRRFVRDVDAYVQGRTASYKQEARAEAVIKQQIREDTRQRLELEVQLAQLYVRMAQLDRFAKNR